MTNALPEGNQRRQLAELLVAVSWWPPQIEFDLKDLNTVVDVIEEQKKQQRVKH